jgi:hypothetical protein
MNKSQVLTLATVVIALAGAATAAVAAEATQVVPPAGTQTRAGVKAERQRSPGPSARNEVGEATQFVDAPAASRGLASAPQPDATRTLQFGEATVFIDAPGTRSRADVRAEARAAARGSRGNGTRRGA